MASYTKQREHGGITPERMEHIALALKQSDPINWIRRLREFNRETDPPRLDVDELNVIITNLMA